MSQFFVPFKFQKPIEIPFQSTKSIKDPQGKVTWFCEDIGLNNHHFKWHAVYPLKGPEPKVYDKDRRGELFYYMHHQLVAL